MEVQSNNFTAYQIDSTKGDFYDPLLNKLDDPSFVSALLNDSSILESANSILNHPQFSKAYRQKMVDCIKEQYQQSSIELSKDSLVLQNIEKLADENTLTVTTGQQIHIFLGPFFVVNKILSCCAEARKYDSEIPDSTVIPIFWMATEDHDFDEIRSARLYDETYTWDVESDGPVGRLNPKSLLELVNQAKARIDQTEDNLEFLNVCAFAYGTCSTFANATRYIIHRYFEQTGIVIIDPDNPFFKSQFAEVTRADLVDHSPSEAIVSSIASMKEFGIKAPINTRPINTFYLTDNHRNRIEETTSGNFMLVGTKTDFSRENLLKQLKSNPERFSPNALLRPVYQQLILPNIHYVCGASEIKYWLELRTVMQRFDVKFPKLSVRKSMFFISQKNIHKLDKDQIPLDDLFLSTERLTEKILTKQESGLSQLDTQIEKIRHETTEVLKMLEVHEFAKSKKLQNTVNQLIKEIESQKVAVIFKKSGANEMLIRILKMKANLASETYVQERNKYIIGMVSELQKALIYFIADYKSFLNHQIISVSAN